MKKLNILILSFLSLVSFAQENTIEIDYRSLQSPVKNQGFRGTCTAFAIAGALEVLPNSYPDVSEKYIYACMKTVDYMYKDFFEGAHLKEYIATLPKYGILPEALLPYNPTFKYKINKEDIKLRKVILEADIGPVSLLVDYVPKARKTVPSYALQNYPIDSIRNPKFIINLLKTYKTIPVSYHLYMGGWRKNVVSTKNPVGINNCGYQIKSLKTGKLFPATAGTRLYGKDFFNKIFQNNSDFDFIRTDSDDKHYGGHAVNIVGVDGDNFIIKNSWGTDWGTEGYVYLSFDYHKIFVTDLLTISEIRDK
ncbi:C1 family peptidase [Halpernia sp.]|uniref:C1 family peptidase n=1 Tax=Halpernia sp. TaxID=2782209 RepID=UPI003A950586